MIKKLQASLLNTIASATGTSAASDLLLLQISTAWQKSLDVTYETFAIALGIDDTFGRVRHKLKSRRSIGVT